MLKDATIMLQRGSITAQSLIRKVIVKSPVEIKSLLLQIAGNNSSWDAFRKAAEDSSWVAYPE
ncbi:hypothetical protein COBT_001677 [Conglomerata obtusa]